MKIKKLSKNIHTGLYMVYYLMYFMINFPLFGNFALGGVVKEYAGLNVLSGAVLQLVIKSC